MTRITSSQLRDMVQRLSQDGAIDRGDVDRLVDAVMDDGALSLTERAELTELLTWHADKIDQPGTRLRLEAFLDLPDGGLRALGHQLERDDGVIDFQDAEQLVALAGRRGALDGDARVSLRALMLGSKLTDGARGRMENALAAAPAPPHTTQTIEAGVAPNLTIPDNRPEGIESRLRLDDPRPIEGLRVELELEHSYQGDLVVSLVAPDGDEVKLHDRTGRGADDLIGVYPTDLAPAESLDAFVGKPLAGEWRLKVTDLAGQDVGALRAWRLLAEVEAVPVQPRARIDLVALAERLAGDGAMGRGAIDRPSRELGRSQPWRAERDRRLAQVEQAGPGRARPARDPGPGRAARRRGPHLPRAHGARRDQPR